MKLRISGNTIRLRLSQSEVKQIENGQSVIEKLLFPIGSDHFSFGLQASNNDHIEVLYTNNSMSLKVPQQTINTWASTDQVGIYHTVELIDDQELKLSIEKDFKCLHKRPDEDESDNFINPLSVEEKG